MTDIRQTPEYAHYLNLLGWKKIKIQNGQVFVKKFPVIGTLLKAQRILPPIPFEEIEKIARSSRSFLVQIDQENPATSNFAKFGYQVNKKPYFPTKTIQIDLTQSEKEIFDAFSEAKRRAVRKAIKNKILVREARDFKEFLWLKKRSLWEKPVIPFMVGQEIAYLFGAFFPKNAKILIAYHQKQPVAGIFLLHSNKVAYYWLAAATKQGKKLFAPTLLAFEAFKTAKKTGCEVFDFEGVYDQRYPVKSWLGFTKFKQGFGGKEILYPPSLYKNSLKNLFASGKSF